MRDRRTLEVELDHILLGLLDRLANGHRNFARLAHSKTGMAALITYNHERREAEILAAFHDFRHAVDRNDLVFQVSLVGRNRPANRKGVFEFLFRHDSELQARFTGRLRKGLHAAVVSVAASIEHHILNSLRLRAFGNGLADNFGRGDVAAALYGGADFLIERARGDQGAPRGIVNDLRANMTARTVHAKPGSLRRTHDALAHAQVNAFTVHLTRQSSDGYCHSGSPLRRSYAAAVLAPALPAFFLSRS